MANQVLLRSSLVLLCISLGAKTALAQDEGTRWFSFSFDNDIFAGTDGGYTNGIYLNWAEIMSQDTFTQRGPKWHHWLQSRMTKADQAKRIVTTNNVGQSMITPSDILQYPPDPNDTPYAGLLYWQGTVLANKDQRTDFANLLLGVVGPAALAEQSQKIVHSATGSEAPLGWDYQLRNEPLFAVQYGRLWQRAHLNKEKRAESDFVGGYQTSIGNFESSVELSVYARIGKKLETSYSTMAMVSNRELNPITHSNRWFAYIGGSVRYIANNIALDGNTFRSGPSIDYDNLQNRYIVGMAFSRKNWGLSYNFVDIGSLENGNANRQRFGSLTFLWRR